MTGVIVSYVPPHIQQQYPNLPPHVQQGLAHNDALGRASAAAAAAAGQTGSGFGAVAYSASTGKYGWAWQCNSYIDAENTAAYSVGAPDARALYWGQNTYLALAVGASGATGWGSGMFKRSARKSALQNCRQYDLSCGIVLLFHTSNGRNLA
jgi:hypothetical protein